MLHEAPSLCVIAHDVLNAVAHYIMGATLKFNYDKCSQLNYRAYFYLMFVYLFTQFPQKESMFKALKSPVNQQVLAEMSGD